MPAATSANYQRTVQPGSAWGEQPEPTEPRHRTPKWRCEVYEPEFSPGGFQGSVYVHAENTHSARRKAITSARHAWKVQDSVVLAVWKIVETNPEVEGY